MAAWGRDLYTPGFAIIISWGLFSVIHWFLDSAVVQCWHSLYVVVGSVWHLTLYLKFQRNILPPFSGL